MAFFKNKTSSKRLWFFSLVVFLFSVSLVAAQNKVVVIPLFDGQSESPGPRAPVAKTGQWGSLAPGDDGDLEKGVAWPNPRFRDNGHGTVTDRLTGLIWMKNANCFGIRLMNTALNDCNTVSEGYCGLTDGSAAGDWRLPNINELKSLLHYGVHSPPLPNTAGTGQWAEGDPFTGVQLNAYLSSTRFAFNATEIWGVYLRYGDIRFSLERGHVWCVRGGQ